MRWFCLHRWLRWSDPVNAPGVGVFQLRQCDKCRRLEKRWVVTLK